MTNSTFIPVSGIIQSIQPFSGQCCQQMLSVRTTNGITHLIVSPDTYVINNIRLRPSMSIIAFYDVNVPTPLIFPPQFRAVVIGLQTPNESIMMSHFGRNLVSSDNSLKLNLSPRTEIVTQNGQIFSCSLENRVLIVYYSATTRSIPPQTTPRKIIVMC